MEVITEEQHLKQLKSELKHWEHSFLKNEGHKPTKLDISNNKEIANKYRAYRKLRTKLNEKTNTNEHENEHEHDHEHEHEHAHESRHSKSRNKPLNNNDPDQKNVVIKPKTTKNEINNLINKNQKSVNINHEYNKAHNQIPNKLFAMTQNTNLKKKVHNYGIVHSSEVNENENLSIFNNQNVFKESQAKKIEMNEKYNLKDNRKDSDMLSTNSIFVSSSPKERMLDLESRDMEQKKPEYQEENTKKSKDTSLNNLILPAPKIIVFNKNEQKHELIDDEIKDIQLNSESKRNINNKNKLRKKDGTLFKDGFESKSDKKTKRKNNKKEDNDENIDISDYSERKPSLKENHKKDNDKVNKKKKNIKKSINKKDDDSSDEEKSTIKSHKRENKKNNKEHDSEKDNDSDKEQNNEKETEENENDKSQTDSIINNKKKYNFLDALPAENYSTFERIEKNHILRCRVIRKVGKISHIHPEYYLYNDDTNEFILAARRRKNIKKMDYIITTDENSITKTSSGYVGKLIVKQDKFTLLNAENYNPSLPDKGLYESATIFYNRNSSPREMFVALPALHLEYGSTEYSKDFFTDAKNNNTDKIIVLRNNPPRWNEATQSHCLNFSGRVTQPSIKNFQLIYDKGNSYMKYFGSSYDDSQKFEPISNDNPILLQFGRCGPNNFSLDIRYPLTPLEAFAISLTTFDAFDTLY
ncbi:Tub-domain-containing protein [Neocallimastix lanati (nom. inval.)]|uniref:DNA replication regulator SLD2 n=1 Tax=Neocallimastix californiae TaxID=1754190 RepID=A0A1Y1Z3A6_9FUNG|nr:Tub-domain-containing protein [Neocallimastix sp. JGI-2020a]ORY04699.1 Tub-domain-containing protein [Neocallimastix californiae]|eukprot:ORY04699.1 Tub-domain-containing protein [Neocallimastix californiae]